MLPKPFSYLYQIHLQVCTVLEFNLPWLCEGLDGLSSFFLVPNNLLKLEAAMTNTFPTLTLDSKPPFSQLRCHPLRNYVRYSGFMNSPITPTPSLCTQFGWYHPFSNALAYTLPKLPPPPPRPCVRTLWRAPYQYPKLITIPKQLTYLILAIRINIFSYNSQKYHYPLVNYFCMCAPLCLVKHHNIYDIYIFIYMCV